MTEQTRLSKREKRLLRQETRSSETNKPNHGLEMKNIQPLTAKQKDMFDAYHDGSNIMAHGIAGTGKTFLAMKLALEEIFSGLSSYKKVIIVRSVVPTRDIGFLPGTEQQKAEVYEAPYVQICTELFGRGDSYALLKHKFLIEFVSTSYIRGTTINDAIVIVDEMQNLNFHELDSIITRLGKNSKIVFCGDFRQSDLSKEKEKDGLKNFMTIIQKMKMFEFIEFEKQDIVRSPLVKSYIITKSDLNL